MSDAIITQQRLLELLGLKQKAALRRHLKQAGIPFKEPRGVIFTTQGALDAALVGNAKKKNHDDEPRWDL